MKENNSRRKFLTTALTGAAAFGLSSIPFSLDAETGTEPATKADPLFAESEKLFAAQKGKHKMVFDMWKHTNGAALSWALTLMDTYNEQGIPDKELSIAIVLRYAGGPLALNDTLWAKYEFGKRIELKDPETDQYATRNLYAKCPTEDDDCFELFQKRGGLICVCKKGTEHSAESLAEKMKVDKEVMKKEFFDAVLPGIHLVPSGIWAMSRLQDLGFRFVSAG
ncbi:MAG: twin-arginine translocation signal domain-containing protein [Bacteroidia bacterium]